MASTGPLTSSIIICTRNRPEDIIQCLDSIAAQTYAPTELIVIDSSDVPLNQTLFADYFVPSRFGATTLVYEHMQPGLTAQRNRGVRRASGDVLYFFDDDVLLSPHYLHEMQTHFVARPSYAGGMGNIAGLSIKKRSFDRAIRTIFLLQNIYGDGSFTASGMPQHAYGREDFCTVNVLGGCCMAYRSWVFKKHLFDEKLQRYAYMEDVDFSRRVSRTAPLFYCPSARLEHRSSPVARDTVVENRAMYVRNYSYLFFKNEYPGARWKILPYWWSVLGLFVQAAMWRDVRQMRGYARGLWQFYAGKEDSGCTKRTIQNRAHKHQ